MPDAVLRQHRLQLRVGHFIPQRFALHLIGIDIARADMAQQIELRRSRRLQTLSVACRGGGDRFPCCRSCSHWGRPTVQSAAVLQTVGLAQRIAQGAEPGETVVSAAPRRWRYPPGCRTARWGIGLELVLLSRRGADRRSWRRASGRKIWACGSWPSGPLALRPAVVMRSAGCRWPRRAAVAGGRSERWHGFSGAGSGSSKPYEQGECGREKHVSSKCPTVKVEGVFSTRRRRFLCGNAGLHAIVLHCQRSIAAAPVGGQSSRSWVTDRRNGGGPVLQRPAAEPGAQAGIRRLKGSSSSNASGAPAGRAAHPRPLPAESVAGSRGRSPPARRGCASSTAVFAPRRARSPAAPAVNFARR